MVWQQALYLVNLLCKFVPCDYNFPYPDTSLSEQQAFKSQITLGFGGTDTGQLDSVGVGLGGWGKQEHPSWVKEHEYTNSDPLVAITKTGKLRGYWMKVVGGRKIRAYEGIPYAEPPVGYFRFNAPAPKIPWSGLLHAVKKGPKCLQVGQLELHRVVGSEDCLCLNIYSPQVISMNGRNASRFPVMVFIHGGGFMVGSGGDYGPSYLLQQDLILVTLNWRVGIIGFMSTGDYRSPGNYGLKDQALAIQWVYDNIEYFNGDPNKITIIGQEAGGASVHLHMMSAASQRYFQSAVSMSGTAFNHWVFHNTDKAKELTKHFAKKMKCPDHSSEAIVACLRRVDAYELVKTQIKFLDDWPLPVYLFRPVIEEPGQATSFITETPDEAYKNNRVAPIPWITGFTEDEGLTFLLPSVFRGTMKELRAHWNHLAPDFLDYELLNIDQDEITRKVNWLYFKQLGPEKASIKTFSDALSTRFTITGVHKGLQAHCLTAPTYAYMFSYNGKYNLATIAGIRPNEWGVGQGEDVFYLLNSTHLYQGFKKSDHELILSKIMLNLFGNFASKRYPTFTLENHEDFQIWNPIVDPRNMSFLLIHKKIKMVPEPYLQSTVYWESLGLPDTVPWVNSSDHYTQHMLHMLPSPGSPPPVSKVNFLEGQRFPQLFDQNSGGGTTRLQLITPPPPPAPQFRQAEEPVTVPPQISQSTQTPSPAILPPEPALPEAAPEDNSDDSDSEPDDIFLKPETDIFDLRSVIATRSTTSTTEVPTTSANSTTTATPPTWTPSSEPVVTTETDVFDLRSAIATRKDISTTETPSYEVPISTKGPVRADYAELTTTTEKPIETTTAAPTTTSSPYVSQLQFTTTEEPVTSPSEDDVDPYLPSWAPTPTSMTDTTTSTTTTTSPSHITPQDALVLIDQEIENKLNEIPIEQNRDDDYRNRGNFGGRRFEDYNLIKTSVSDEKNEDKFSDIPNSGTPVSTDSPSWNDLRETTSATPSTSTDTQNNNNAFSRPFSAYDNGFYSSSRKLNSSISDSESYNIMK